jgi:Arc/MetJ-type ribon-helix-helix transcriptional regulator
MTLTVELTPDQQKFVNEQVKAGLFPSPEKVVEAGLARLMLDPEMDDTLDAEDLAAIARSEAQIARGEVMDWKEARVKLSKKHLGR